MKPFYKTILLLFVNSLFLVFNSFSQQAPGIEWQHCYGGTGSEECFSINLTNDGGYIAAGYTSSNDGDVTGLNGVYDYWVIKIDSAGALQWQKTLGNSGQEKAYSVQQTADGGYAVFGQGISSSGSNCHSGGEFWLVKLDTNGNVQWEKCFGGSGVEFGRSIQQTADGGYIMTGWTSSNNGDVSGYIGGTTDCWVVKTDSVGNIEWQKCLGGTNEDLGYYIRQTVDGGYILAVHTSSNNVWVNGNHGGKDYWIVKLDSYGNVIWQKCFGGSYSDYPYSVQQTTDGGYIVAGGAQSHDGNASCNHDTTTLYTTDYLVLKLDSAGQIQWRRCLGGAWTEIAWSVQQTVDGGYIVSGEATSDDGDVTGYHGTCCGDAWLTKLDNSGNLIWQKCFGGFVGDAATSIRQTPDMGYIFGAITSSNDGDVSGNHDTTGNTEDYWIVKLSPDTVTGIVNHQSSINNLQIFPNPSSGIFQITFPSSSNQKTNYTLEVINTLGQTVFTSPPAPLQRRGESSAISLDLSFLPKGIYVLRLCVPSGKINDGVSALSNKFVIE